MPHRLWPFSAATSLAFLAALSMGCQEPTTNTTNNGGSDQGGGGSGAGNNTGAGGDGTGAGSMGGNDQGGGGAGTGGMIDVCADGATDATVYDVTKGNVGAQLKVRTKAIAMSRKFIISKNSCLWGVLVSASETESGNQITEAQPYSGILVVSDEANTDPCPGTTDAIPADIQPGDLVDIVGTSEKFILDFVMNNPCGTFPTDTDIPTFQISDACKVEKIGTAPIPAAHELTPAELTLLATQKGDAAVVAAHNAWGNVRVRAVNVQAVLWDQSPNPNTVTGPFGIFKLGPSTPNGYEVHDKFYYVNGSSEVCEIAPKFDQGTPPAPVISSWDFVEGFHYLDYCTWAMLPFDKCAMSEPQSLDCESDGITSCLP